MFSLSDSFVLVVEVVSRTVWALFATGGWAKSTSWEFVAFEVKSSLAGSAEEDFRSLDELTDGVALTLAVLCGADAEGASPLAA